MRRQHTEPRDDGAFSCMPRGRTAGEREREELESNVIASALPSHFSSCPYEDYFPRPRPSDKNGAWRRTERAAAFLPQWGKRQQRPELIVGGLLQNADCVRLTLLNLDCSIICNVYAAFASCWRALKSIYLTARTARVGSKVLYVAFDCVIRPHLGCV